MSANQPTQIQIEASFPSDTALVRDMFTQAAGEFVRYRNTTPEIWAASTDWFLEPWGRDTFIALPGLLFPMKRFEEAKDIFRAFGEYEQNGIIPNRILPDKTLYNTVDASLWFVHAVQQYLEWNPDTAFAKEILPTLRSIVKHYQKGTSYHHFEYDQHIYMDTDGLIFSPAQATWMDADPSGNGTQMVTPRQGKCVEINALWYGALQFVAELETKKKAEDLQRLASKVKLSFNRKFWNKEEQCLKDVIDGDPHSGAIRPNQIFAISHGDDLLSGARQRQVLKSVTQDLLTPAGLRTLSPRDSHFEGFYNTYAPMQEKDLAYHQGTIWPWLIGPYCDALVKVGQGKGKYDFAIHDQLKDVLAPLVDFCLESEYESLPEVFSGNKPYTPGGTRSQAWSVAEILRVMVQYGVL